MKSGTSESCEEHIHEYLPCIRADSVLLKLSFAENELFSYVSRTFLGTSWSVNSQQL
jgi:hypothetical protein